MTRQDQIDQARDFILLFIDKVKRQTENFEAFTEVSQPELEVLRILARGEPLIIKDLARQLPGVSLSSLTRVLDRLEQHGYLVRQSNPGDRRTIHLVLTPQGSQILERYHRVIEQMAQVMLGALTPDERLVLIELYTKITTQLNSVPLADLLAESAGE